MKQKTNRTNQRIPTLPLNCNWPARSMHLAPICGYPRSLARSATRRNELSLVIFFWSRPLEMKTPFCTRDYHELEAARYMDMLEGTASNEN